MRRALRRLTRRRRRAHVFAELAAAASAPVFIGMAVAARARGDTRTAIALSTFAATTAVVEGLFLSQWGRK